jgi:hypothetical protein
MASSMIHHEMHKIIIKMHALDTWYYFFLNKGENIEKYTIIRR